MQKVGLLAYPFPPLLPLALAVACQDSDIRNVNAMIIGPPETPYEFGFFEVRSWSSVSYSCIASI